MTNVRDYQVAAVRTFQAAASNGTPIRGAVGSKTAAALRQVLAAKTPAKLGKGACPQCYPHSIHTGGCKGCKCDGVHAEPFVKWAGGKRQSLGLLMEHVPREFGRYFEPFVGGAALYFHLGATGHLLHGAILGDNNALLMNAYGQVKTNVEAVIRELRKFKYDETLFYKVREQFRSRLPVGAPVVWAAQLMYLNRTCYNGLWRVNKKGEFNAPFGDYTNPTICDADNLRRVARVLKATGLMTGDFEKIAMQAVARDFVYFDPPYWPSGSKYGDFTEYSKEPFGPPEQERLRDLARYLKARGVYVVLSNSDVEPIHKLYARGFKIRRIEAKRAINSKSTRRGKVGELIIT